MKNLRYILLSAVALVTLAGCDKWIDNAKTPSNSLTYDDLRRPGMMASVKGKTLTDGALTANVKTLAGQASSAAFMALGAMTDELSPTKVPNALVYKALSDDNASSAGGEADGVFNNLQNLRARAEELLAIEASTEDDGSAGYEIVRAYARHTGHLYAGYAYKLLADCFSSNPSAAGEVPVNGKNLTHEALYAEAITHLQAAVREADAEVLRGIGGAFNRDLAVGSAEALLCKLYMSRGQYTEASAHLDAALGEKATMQIIYNVNGSPNGLYSTLGETARDVEVDADIVNSLRNDAERKAVPTATNKEGNRYLTNLQRHSPLTITDGAEMLLIRAELIVRGVRTGDARATVNRVVTTYDAASALTTQPTLSDIDHLRRVYLFLRGERTLDYRRGLVDGAKQQTWQSRRLKWMPLPENEIGKTND